MKRPTPQELQEICDLYKEWSEEELNLVIKTTIKLESYDRCFDHALEDLLDLLARFRHWCIDQRLEVQGSVPAFRDESFWDNLMSEATSDAIPKTLESFLRCLYKALYADRKMLIDGEECACLEGTKRVPGVDGDKLTLTPLFNGQLVAAYGDPGYIALPAIEGRRGAVDPSKKELKSAIKGSVELRNHVEHGKKLSRQNRSAAYRCLLSTFLAIVDYWYELLQDLLGSSAPATTSFAQHRQVALEAEAESYVCDTYVERIESLDDERRKQLYAEVENILIPWQEEVDDEDDDDDEGDDEHESVQRALGNEHDQMAVEEIDFRDAVRANPRCCVLGASGSGKSTMLHQILLHEAIQWRDNPQSADAMLPVLIHLNELRRGKKIFDYLYESVISLKTSYDSEALKEAVGKHLQQLVDEGRVLFLFDGLNELENKELLKDLIDYTKTYPENHYLFTGRIVEFARDASLLTDYTKFQVAPLSDHLIDEFLMQCCADEAQRTTIRSKIACDADMVKLATNPMHLRMMVEVLATTKAEEVNTRGQLYIQFFHDILEDEETMRDAVLKESRSLRADCDMLLRQMALQCQFHERVMRIEDLIRLVDSNCFETGNIGVRDVVFHLVRLQILKVGEQADTVSFFHDSFMEYYCAKCFADSFFSSSEEKARELLHARFAGRVETVVQHLEMLQMCIDVLRDPKRKNTRPVILRFIKELLACGIDFGHSSSSPLLSLESDGYHLHLSGDELPAMNPMLEHAATLVSKLQRPTKERWTEAEESHYDILEKASARALVECYLLNYARLYERILPRYDEHEKTVKKLMGMCGRLFSTEIRSMLLSPFWLRMWMVPKDCVIDGRAYHVGASGTSVTAKVQANFIALVRHTTDYTALYRMLCDMDEQIHSKYYKQRIFLYKRILFGRMPDPARRTLFEQLSVETDPSTCCDAQTLLLFVEDITYVLKHLQSEYLSGFYGHQLFSLLRTWNSDPRVAELLFSDELITHMPKMLRARLVRFFLFRECYELKPMTDFLWERKGYKTLGNRDVIQTIFDLIPLQYIPQEVIACYYDQTTIDCQQQAAQRTHVRGIRYRVLASDYRSVKLAIPDLKESFGGGEALFVDELGNELRFPIVEDSYCETQWRHYTMRGKSGLLPLQGELRVDNDSRTLFYVAVRQTDDALHLILTETSQWTLLRDWLRQGAAIWVGDQLCEVTYTMQKLPVRRDRVIALRREDGVSFPPAAGRMRLMRDGAEVLYPDPELITMAYQMPSLFRRLKLSKRVENRTRQQVRFPYYIIEMQREGVLRIGTNFEPPKTLIGEPFNLLSLGRGKIKNIQPLKQKGRVMEIRGVTGEMPLSGELSMWVDGREIAKVHYGYMRPAGDERDDVLFLHLFDQKEVDFIEANKAELRGAQVRIGGCSGQYAGLLNEIRRKWVVDLSLTRPAEMMKTSGIFEVYDRAEDNDGFSDWENKIDAELLGFDQKSIHLLTEQVANNLIGACCEINQQVYVVERVEPQGRHLLELRLASQVPLTLPRYGALICRIGQEIKHLPYVLAISDGRIHTLRIIHAETIEAWRKGALKQALRRGRLNVREYYLELDEGQLLNGNDRLSVLTLQSKKGIPHDKIPCSMRLGFYDKEGEIKLCIRSGWRNMVNNLMKVLCFPLSGKMSLLLLPSQPSGANYTHLHLHSNLMPSRFFRVAKHDKRVNWVGECSYDASVELPRSGELTLPGRQGRYPFVRLADRRMLICSIGLETLSWEEFSTMQTLTYGEDCLVSVREQQLREGYAESLSMVTGDPIHLPEEQYGQAIAFELYGYHPLCNSQAQRFGTDVQRHQFYGLSMLRYRIVTDDVISIVKPDNSIEGLWCRLDDMKQPYAVQEVAWDPQRVADKRLYLRVVTPDLMVRKIPRSGAIRFYRDHACTELVKVQVSHLSPLIEVGSPERYHASVCDLLVEEMKQVDRFNDFMVEFFLAKSRGYMLLERYLHHPMAQKPLPIGIVLNAKRLSVKVYRPSENLAEPGTILSSGDMSGLLSVGDLVLVERNNKLTRLPEHTPSRQLGYLSGLMLYPRREEKEVFIHVIQSIEESRQYNDTPDFFYFYGNSDYVPQVGDNVWFFPSRNIRSKNPRPMAECVQWVGSGIREGVVERVAMLEGDRKVLYIADMADENLKGSVSVTPSARAFKSFDSLRKGDLCRFAYLYETVPNPEFCNRLLLLSGESTRNKKSQKKN